MSTIETNRDRIVEQAVLGEVAPATRRKDQHWRVGADGRPAALPGSGAITYNVRVGDSALDWEADHVEPGASVRAEKENANTALNLLACVGNTAVVVSGDAKGARGAVTGKHGGIEHVLVDFARDDLERLAIGDKVQVRARGLGLRLLGAPDVHVMNTDPDLLEAMGLSLEDGRVRVPVTHRVPAAIMGSGIGHADVFTGDYDIQLFDPAVVEKHGLRSLRLGDVVAVLDADHTYGRIYKGGAVSVGVVVHSRCTQAGHGPGLTTLLTSAEGLILPQECAGANIAEYLEIGTARGREPATDEAT
jgi:hypothetical protein